jgi:hypothetical protein
MEKKQDLNPSIQPVSSETDPKNKPKAENFFRRWGRSAKKDAADGADATDATDEEKAKELDLDGSTVKNFFVRTTPPAGKDCSN